MSYYVICIVHTYTKFQSHTATYDLGKVTKSHRDNLNTFRDIELYMCLGVVRDPIGTVKVKKSGFCTQALLFHGSFRRLEFFLSTGQVLLSFSPQLWEGDPGFLVFWVSLLPWSGLPTVPVLPNGIYPCPVCTFRALFSAIGMWLALVFSGLWAIFLSAQSHVV